MTGAQAEGSSSPGITMIFPGDREIRLSGDRFKAISDRYCRMEPLPPVIDSRYDVSDDVIASFRGCCDGEPDITEDNFNDIWALAEEWELRGLMEQCSTFADDYFEDAETVGLRVLTAICHRIELMGETAALENILHGKLPLFANEIRGNDDMCDLVNLIDFALILRVFERNNCSLGREHLEEVFSFMLLCLDLYPDCGSLLFENADLSRLNQRQMTELLRNDKLDHRCLTPSYVSEFTRGFRTRTFCTIGTCIVVLCCALMVTTLLITELWNIRRQVSLLASKQWDLDVLRRKQRGSESETRQKQRELESCQISLLEQGSKCQKEIRQQVALVLRNLSVGAIDLASLEAKVKSSS